MVLGLLIFLELVALGVAIFAMLYNLHFAILTVAVIAFLVCGHFVRAQLTQRGAWAEQQEAAAASPGEQSGASDEVAQPDRPEAGERPHG